MQLRERIRELVEVPRYPFGEQGDLALGTAIPDAIARQVERGVAGVATTKESASVLVVTLGDEEELVRGRQGESRRMSAQLR